MKLVIERESWLRGEGSDASELLRPGDGKMCCLGFYGLACGYLPEDLERLKTPASLLDASKWPAWLLEFPHVTRECARLMSVNDNPDCTSSEREEEIIRRFAAYGVEVEFK